MRMIDVSPDGQPRWFRRDERQCVTPEAAMAMAEPGETVRFLPGVYRRTLRVSLRGSDAKEIRIVGVEGAKFDLGLPMTPARAGHLSPDETEGAAIKLNGAEHVVIEGFDFANCWPSVIFARGIRHVTIRDCRADGGQFFLYMRRARNDLRTPCSDITVRHCVWRQDVDQLMWRGIARWPDVKNPDHVYSAFNGALVGGYAFGSKLRIAKCRVTHAFNGVRMDAPAGDGGRYNEDVTIEECDFDHIRDNAIEPEKRFRRWWVSRCRMLNVHAVFSLDDLDGEGFVVAGCQMALLERPDDISNRGGQVWKLRGEKAVRGVVVVHNSIALAKAYVKKGAVDGLQHAANALLRVEPRQPLFSCDFKPDRASRLLGDVSNDPEFPKGYNDRCRFNLDGERSDNFLDLSLVTDVSYLALPPRGRLILQTGQTRIAPPDHAIDLPGNSGGAGAGTSLLLRASDTVGAVQTDGEPYDVFSRMNPTGAGAAT